MRSLPATLAVFSSLFTGTLCAQAELFTAGARVPVGRGSGTVLVADLDRNGKPDLLSRHLEPPAIVVLLGNGAGVFNAADSFRHRLNYAPADTKLGDVNGDGVLDLATTHNRSDVVEILLGDGRGRFRPAPGSPITASTATDSLNKRTLHLADLDGDGDLDIVTANGRRLNSLSTLMNDGRGRFARGTGVRLPAGDGYSVELGDVSGDGRIDIVVVTRTSFAEDAEGRVLVLIGAAKGTFASGPGSPLVTPPGPSRLALGDLDGDRRLDILVTHADGGLTAWRNAGSGRFESAREVFRFTRPAYSPVIDDFNRDGRPDVALATLNSVSVLVNTGKGFRHAAGSPYPAGPGAYYVTASDLNGDGKPDLISSSFEGEELTVLMGR